MLLSLLLLVLVFHCLLWFLFVLNILLLLSFVLSLPLRYKEDAMPRRRKVSRVIRDDSEDEDNNLSTDIDNMSTDIDDN